MSWAEHGAAIAAADRAIDLMQQTINALIVQSQRAATAVAQATGGNNCNAESGREAFSYASTFEEDARGLLDRSTLCKGHLVDYRNGV